MVPWIRSSLALRFADATAPASAVSTQLLLVRFGRSRFHDRVAGCVFRNPSLHDITGGGSMPEGNSDALQGKPYADPERHLEVRLYAKRKSLLACV